MVEAGNNARSSQVVQHYRAAAVSGPPDGCAEGVRELAKAGTELILFTPFFDQAEQTERLAVEVVPQLS